VSNYFKRFLPFESSGDIVHVEKSGRFDVDVVLKYLFMRVGELRDDICNRLKFSTSKVKSFTSYMKVCSFAVCITFYSLVSNAAFINWWFRIAMCYVFFPLLLWI
jgi:hypothetical protein